MADWVRALCQIPNSFHSGDKSIRQLFDDADPDLSDESAFREAVRKELIADPELMDSWQGYSWDKRTTPSPYIDGLEVGVFDRRSTVVTMHSERLDACVDFIWRESQWVLARTTSE